MKWTREVSDVEDMYEERELLPINREGDDDEEGDDEEWYDDEEEWDEDKE